MPSVYSTPSKQIPEPRSTVPGPEQSHGMKEPAPRTIASLRLTEQARLLIKSKKPDEAIRTLEKALNIDPNNGRNYYFLAEAWMIKGNKIQAIEFNRMARIYLSKDAVWMLKVQQQKERIENIF
ncbi:tetratricopeptide repeat protein [Thermodesulfobacteriota bacterium]